jgi:hypothetical protein
MNCNNAKKIDLVIYLKKQGFEPSKTQGKNVWYLSPFRQESTPSFKVDTVKNLYIDYGEIDSGGTIIDLVTQLHSCTIKEALEKLSTDSFSFPQHLPKITKETKYAITKTEKISNKNLLLYLNERKINLDFAKRFCCQVHYTFDHKKEYYGVGFRNNNNGFEVRNAFYKGCLNGKDITTICNKSQIVSLFESWSDFLSYLTLKKKVPDEDYVILNSTSLVKKVLELVREYSEIKIFFDNDEAGDKATTFLLNNIKDKVTDYRIHYKNYNDLNEYLLARS